MSSETLMREELTRDRPVAPIACGFGGPSVPVQGLKTIQLTPDGVVESRKGTFVIDEESARLIIERFEAHNTPLVIDFEHQSLGAEHAAPDGLAPASGWVHRIWREPGRGLFAFVQWTQKAAEMIRSRQYQFLSPVLLVRKEDRKAVALHSIGLTNLPAIGGMEAVAASQRLHHETEFEIMAEHPSGAAETERLVGELRSLLIEKGTELDAAADRNTVLRGAIDSLKGKKPDEGDDGESADNEEIASSVRTRLGLAEDAGKAETLLALSLVDAGGKREGKAEAELSAMKGADEERRAQELVDKHVLANRISRDDKEQFDSALALAREDPDRFERIMGVTKPLVAPGRTTAPDKPTTNRQKVVAHASREFDDNPELAKFACKAAHINTALREDGLTLLSNEEKEGL